MCYCRSVRTVLVHQCSFEKVINRATPFLDMVHQAVGVMALHSSRSGEITGTRYIRDRARHSKGLPDITGASPGSQSSIELCSFVANLADPNPLLYPISKVCRDMSAEAEHKDKTYEVKRGRCKHIQEFLAKLNSRRSYPRIISCV